MARYTDCIMNGPYCGSVRDDKKAWGKPEEEYYAWIYMIYECAEVEVNLNGVDFGEKFGIRRVRSTVAVTKTIGYVPHPGADEYGFVPVTTGKFVTCSWCLLNHRWMASLLTVRICPSVLEHENSTTSISFATYLISEAPTATLYTYRAVASDDHSDKVPAPCLTKPSVITQTITQVRTKTILPENNLSGISNEIVFEATLEATITQKCEHHERVPYTTLVQTLKTPIPKTTAVAYVRPFTAAVPFVGRLEDGGYGGALSPKSAPMLHYTPVETGGGHLRSKGGDNGTASGDPASKSGASGGLKIGFQGVCFGYVMAMGMFAGAFFVFGNVLP